MSKVRDSFEADETDWGPNGPPSNQHEIAPISAIKKLGATAQKYAFDSIDWFMNTSRKNKIIASAAGFMVAISAFGAVDIVRHGTEFANNVSCSDWTNGSIPVGTKLDGVADKIVRDQGLSSNKTTEIRFLLLNHADNIGKYAPEQVVGGPLVVAEENFEVPSDCSG